MRYEFLESFEYLLTDGYLRLRECLAYKFKTIKTCHKIINEDAPDENLTAT